MLGERDGVSPQRGSLERSACSRANPQTDDECLIGLGTRWTGLDVIGVELGFRQSRSKNGWADVVFPRTSMQRRLVTRGLASIGSLFCWTRSDSRYGWQDGAVGMFLSSLREGSAPYSVSTASCLRSGPDALLAVLERCSCQRARSSEDDSPLQSSWKRRMENFVFTRWTVGKPSCRQHAGNRSPPATS